MERLNLAVKIISASNWVSSNEELLLFFKSEGEVILFEELDVFSTGSHSFSIFSLSIRVIPYVSNDLILLLNSFAITP